MFLVGFLSSLSSVDNRFVKGIIGFYLWNEHERRLAIWNRIWNELNRKEKARALPSGTNLYSEELTD